MDRKNGGCNNEAFGATNNDKCGGTIFEIASSDASAAKTFINDTALNKISSFCGTIGSEGKYKARVYQGNRSLAAHVTADYHGRYLLELIQNANDAHLVDRDDGEIAIVLALDELPFGTLYVANLGNGFSKENVDALCDMGMSSKPPGESVGNKGLGFRSVHHITDKPEIYSQRAPYSKKEEFDGFCFGFASDDEIDTMLEAPAHRILARQDLPLFHVPSWIEIQPARVKFLSLSGYATAVRLPLRDAIALDDVRREISNLQAQNVPTLLFLNRLKCLRATVIESNGTASLEVSLARTEHKINTGPLLSVVDLENVGQYLVAKAAVHEIAMKDVIAKGVASKQLHPHWEHWEGEGEIAIAARIDEGEVNPLIYTYLPLGSQAVAPFYGYLHGSFFPTSNRKGLDAAVALNSLLIDEALLLAAATVVHLRSPGFLTEGPDDLAKAKFNQNTIAKLAVDFLIWNDVSSLEGAQPMSQAISQAIKERCSAHSFSEAQVVPSLSVDEHSKTNLTWASPSAAKPWQRDEGFFSVQAVARFGCEVSLAPFLPSLGRRRHHTLDAFLKETAERYSNAVSPEQAGHLAEKVALSLLNVTHSETEAWTQYYKELHWLTMTHQAKLSGRSVLLCNDGTLRAPAAENFVGENDGMATKARRGAKRLERLSIFSPAAKKTAQHGGDQNDEFTPPSLLAEHFAFLSAQLEWHGALSQIRVHFENHKLVLPFDSETLLSQLSTIVRLDKRKQTRYLGLRWAFQIWCRARDAGRPLQLRHQHRFLVPTLDDEYLEARETFFSMTWGDSTLGKDLEKLIDAEQSTSTEIGHLRSSLIAPISHKLFSGKQHDSWKQFLIDLGVRRGLHPVERKVSGTITNKDLNEFSFCSKIGLSERCTQRWKAEVIASLPSGTPPASRGGEYVIEGRLWALPGQADFHSFSPEGKELYALLLTNWIVTSTPDHWEVSVHHRYYSNADHREWPTPLASFVRSDEWVPVEQPTGRSVRTWFVKTRDVWLNSRGRSERSHIFLRRPIHRLARILERMSDEAVDTLIYRTKIRQLDSRSTLIYQAAFLAHQYFIGAVDRYYERQFLNMYIRTWQMLAMRWSTHSKVIEAIPNFLVVMKNNNALAIDVTDKEKRPIVYVRDQQNDVASNLVGLDGSFVFDIGAHHSEHVGDVLSSLYPGMVQLVSKIQYQFIVDGQDVVQLTHIKGATEQVPWLPAMLAIAMECMKGAEAQRLPADRAEVLQRLELVKLLFAQNIGFRIADREIFASETLPQSVCVRQANQAIIIVRAQGEKPNWADFEHSLSGICESVDAPHLSPYLMLMVRELRGRSEVLAGPVDIDEALKILGDSLGLEERAVSAARAVIGGDIQRALPLLRAVIHALAGEQGLAIFEEGARAANTQASAWEESLKKSIAGSTIEFDKVLDACVASLSASEVRDRLDLDFYDFNQSLIATDQDPDTYPELHGRYLRGYISNNEIPIIECLRNAAAPLLSEMKPAPDYARWRLELTELEPSGDWLIRYKELPLSVLDDYLASWLKNIGAPKLRANPYKLPSLEQVRHENAKMVRGIASVAGPLIRAWCGHRRIQVSAFWIDDENSAAAVRNALESAGVFDHVVLNEETAISWMGVVGVWPVGMPPTLDRKTLGVSDTDVEQAHEKTRREKELHEIQARSVPFNGRPVDPRNVDWHALANELRGSLNKMMLSASLSATSNLAQVPNSSEKGQGGTKSGKANGPAKIARPPSEKTDLIGRLGEFAVYYWLKNALPNQDIDQAWVSRNRQCLVGGHGDDGLGYDFSVGYRNQKWLIEVKASLDDPRAFEMGETEVRTARRAARNRSGVKYVIAYVKFVGDPSLTAVEMLPNPMTEEGEAVLSIAGEGIRYKFQREKSM
jgi:hypothetical protein